MFPIKNEKILICSFLLIGLAIRLYISWLDLETLFQKTTVDDAFFYMKLAQNIASGNGATFDGEVFTNGFHPVYALLLVPVFMIIPGKALISLHLGLTILSIFNILSAILIFAIVKRLAGSLPATISIFIWLFNPYVIMISLNGVEASVLVFFEAICIYWYIRMQETMDFRVLRLMVLGVVLAMAILSRVDAIFLFGAMAIDIFYRTFKEKKEILTGIKRVLYMGFSASIVMSPWLLWSLLKFGTIRQISGVVLPHFTHAMYLARYKSYLSIDFIRYELFYLKLWLIHIIKYGGGPLVIFISLVILAGVIFWGGREKKRMFASMGRISFLLLFSALTVGFYALYFWGWLRPWYYLPIIMVVTIYLGIISSYIIDGLITKKIKWADRWMLPVLLFLLSLNFVYIGHHAWERGLFPFQKQLYEATVWAAENTEDSSRIGTFSSGIFGYLSNRKVIDLAGVVNQDVYKARLEKRLYKYFLEKRLDYLIDREDMVEFNQSFAETNYIKDLEPVKRFGPDPSDIVVYKFKKSAEAVPTQVK